MNRSDTVCDDDRLRLLLQADEDSHEVRLATQHVDECAHCQSRLEQLAADKNVWREAQAVLTAEGGDQRDAADFVSPWRPSRWNRRPTAVAIVSLLMAGSHFFTSESNRPGYAVPSNPSAASASSGPTNDPDRATAWDATASDIDFYREDVTPFEIRSQHLWDATPSLKQE